MAPMAPIEEKALDLHIGDLVYFQRTANELGSKYG